MRRIPINNKISFRLLLPLVLTLASIAAAQPQGGFVPGLDVSATVRRIVVQPDGKIILAGYLAVSPSLGDGYARYDKNGVRDTSFQITDCETPFPLVALPDGKLLCGREAVSTPGVFRKNADGSSDSSFNAAFTRYPGAIAVAADGKIIVTTGAYTSGQTLLPAMVVRLNSDGSLDSSFNATAPINSAAPANTYVQAAIALPDGKVIIAGWFTEIGSIARPGIARLNSDGSLDTSFVPPALTAVQSALPTVAAAGLSADGKIYIGGSFSVTGAGANHKNLIRLNADGSHDTTFQFANGPAQTGGINALVVEPNGKVVAGPITRQGLAHDLALRFDQNGANDNTMTKVPAGTPDLWTLTRAPDGAILAGGSFGVDIFNKVLRYRPDGKVDLPFDRFDYDGDERAELSVYRPSNNTFYFQSANSFWTWQFGAPEDKLAPADYDGDGKTDVAVWRPSNGTWYWVNSSNITFSYMKWGEPGDVPIPGRMGERRRAPFDIYRPSNRGWYRLSFNDSGVPAYLTGFMGQAGDIPLIGNYRGVNLDTQIAQFRPSTGVFYNSYFGSNVQSTNWGQSGDIPLSGDFDGDFRTDVAIYRPSNGQWSLLRSTQGGTHLTWGEPGDIPVPADYDGDQRDDVAVYRPSTGTWYIIGSTEGWRIRQFGEPGDIPVPSAYLYGLP